MLLAVDDPRQPRSSLNDKMMMMFTMTSEPWINRAGFIGEFKGRHDLVITRFDFQRWCGIGPVISKVVISMVIS